MLIVGAGLFGLTAAIELRKKGKKVAVIETRNHIGGNAYSYMDTETNIEVHKYGSHIFHTSNEEVWSFVNKYSSWIPFEHKVFAVANSQVYPLPFNLLTIGLIKNKVLSPRDIENVQRDLVDITNLNTSDNLEAHIIRQIGEDVYKLLVKGYTEKQWGIPASQLPARIIARLPIRPNYNANYFNDTYQALPAKGYGQWLMNMADATEADFYFNTPWRSVRDYINSEMPIVFTGCVDEYFDYSQGKLGWRTLDFFQETLAIKDFQGTAVMNYSDSTIPFTRIHEYKHYPIQREVSQEKTIISREFSRFADSEDEKYYPIETSENIAILEKYRKMENSTGRRILFGGRLGSYKYMDMHTAIASAISKIRNWELL